MGLSALLLASFLSLSQTISAFSIEKRAAVDNCLLGYNISVFEKGSANYTQAAAPFNRRVPFTPAAFAVPLTIQHVQNAISCGRTNGIKVTAKSGGHSYGSHGLGGEDGHLIVDMRHFNSVTVDQEAQTAIIGTGGRLGNVATALYSQGKQAISHGTCPG
jgi:FAD/FMN-containing dehydrogenase